MNPIYYKDQGKGLAFILLHGYCETHEIWQELLSSLSTDFRLIIPDLPGFGKSEIISPAFTIKDIALELSDLLTKIGIRKCVLVGHSLGGYVALALAQERPDLVEGLCLFHSTALPDADEKKANRTRVVDFVDKNGSQPFVDTFVPGLFFQKNQKNIDRVFEIASKSSKNAIIRYAKAMRDRPDLTDFLSKFNKPVYFIAGEKDTFIAVSALAMQANTTLKGNLRVLSETGHMGMFEAPEESIKILKEFGQACFHSVSL